MLKRSLFSVLLLAVVVSMSAPVAQAEGAKIAVVNIQKIMRDAKAAQSARDQLKAKQQRFQEEINKTEKQLQKEDQELAKQRSILSQEAFEKQVRDFRKKATDAQKDVQVKRMELTKGFDAALAQIQGNVTQILADLAKEKGFDLCVPSSQVLYYNPSLDVSEEVLTRLNQKLPSLTVRF